MRGFRLFLLALITIFNTVPAQAITTQPTLKNEFTQTAPLLITAYQTKKLGTSLLAVEVYNDSKNLVDLSDWQLNLATKDAKNRTINVTTKYKGYLQPGEHVTFGDSDTLTFQLTDEGSSTISTIEFKYKNKDINYKPVAAVIKEADDRPMFRMAGSSYSTAAQPFSTQPERAFYDDGFYGAPSFNKNLQIVEIYPYASDCAPADKSDLCGDYVKLQNTGNAEIILDDLVLRTDYYGAERSLSNTFTLNGGLLPGETKLVNRQDKGDKIALTNSGGYIWLEDKWGLAHYDETLTKYESAGSDEQGYSFAASSDGWRWTTTPEPTGANIITPPIVKIAECPTGKLRNPETGRCRTIEEAVNAITACEEGYERNPITNRCRKIITATTAKAPAPCLEGQERNPATNRCRSIAKAVAELLPCDEGYERNPATNRCRKSQVGGIPLSSYPVQPSPKSSVDATGWLAFVAVLAVALGYGAWEWRHEISGLLNRGLGKFKTSK